MYTIEKDFSRMAYGTKITEEFGRDLEINYSSILTKLIKECGRLCESYASDLFVDWNGISQKLKDKTMESSTYLFGIRDMGVDHSKFVLSRYNNSSHAYYEYRKIYRLDVIVEGDSIRMKLYEVDKPYSERND